MNPNPQGAWDARHDAFADCLQRLLDGENLDSVLSAYPQWEAEFRPLLRAALSARLLRPDRVPKAAQMRSMARFLQQAAELTRPVSRIPTRSSPKNRFSPFGLAPLRLSLIALIAVLGLLLGGITTVAASSNSIPGDRLYPVKIFSEQTRLFLTKDPSRRLTLQQSFDQRRVSEVDALIQQRRSLNVNFAGGLRQISQTEWLVGDIRVQVAPGTQLSGDIREGYSVGVDGVLLTDGVVVATHIWAQKQELSGELQKISPGEWIVSGLSLLITADTQIEGQPFIGARLSAAFVLRADNRLEARTIRITSTPPQPTAEDFTRTPLPGATEVLSPASSAQPQVSQTPGEEDSLEPSETVEPSETNEPGDDGEHEIIEPSETPYPSETLKPSETPEPTEDGEENDNDGNVNDNDNVDNENDNEHENENDNEANENDNEVEDATVTPTPTP